MLLQRLLNTIDSVREKLTKVSTINKNREVRTGVTIEMKMNSVFNMFNLLIVIYIMEMSTKKSHRWNKN